MIRWSALISNQFKVQSALIYNDPHWSPTKWHNSKVHSAVCSVQCALCSVQCAVQKRMVGDRGRFALCTVPCWWQGAQQDRQRLCARLHAIALPPVAINTKHAKQSHYMHAILFWLIEIAQMCKRSLKMASKKIMFHWKYHWSVISSTGTYMCSGISNGCLRYLKV